MEIERSEEEWRERLSEDQYYILREKGTERAFTGKYTHFKGDGTFRCAACHHPLFDSESKYDSGSGWPSFWAAIDDNKLKLEKDHSFGMIRTEVMCGRCGSHLGHLFEDGPQPSGQRYCINSLSLDFEEKD